MVEISRETANIGSPITSARPIGTHIAAITAASNEDNIRIEANFDLVLTQIATLSSQFDLKISALRQEVSDRCQKIANELTADVENREKHTDAKLRIITSNVAIQQEQHAQYKYGTSNLVHKHQ